MEGRRALEVSAEEDRYRRARELLLAAKRVGVWVWLLKYVTAKRARPRGVSGEYDRHARSTSGQSREP